METDQATLCDPVDEPENDVSTVIEDDNNDR